MANRLCLQTFRHRHWRPSLTLEAINLGAQHANQVALEADWFHATYLDHGGMNVFISGPSWAKTQSLGVHLDRRLTWRAHAQTMRKRASARRESLFSILVNTAMTRKLGNMIVNAYLLSII